ncbi:MAG: PAS domain-containing protein, partial [Firmicutes bacterium]|nr:PAS domain-containing protein [Bacillota bacterium]
MNKGIRRRLTSSYLILILLAILFLGAYLITSLEEFFLSNKRADLAAQARLASELVVPLLEDQRSGGASPPGHLQKTVENIGRDLDARITVIDRSGMVLADNWEDPAGMDNHAGRPEVRQALAEGQGSTIRYSDTVRSEMLYVSLPVAAPGYETAAVLRVALPLLEIREQNRRLWAMVLTASLIGLLVAAVAGRHLAVRITRPIEEMTKLAGLISRGELHRRIEIRGRDRDETAELGRALNHMAAALKDKISELSREKGRLETVLVNMVSGVIFVDREARIILVNPAAEGILSLDGGEALGFSHVEALHNYELSTRIATVLEGGPPVQAEIELIDPASDSLVEAGVAPIRGENGGIIGAVVVLHDITRIRRLEKIRSEFIANASHEIKTPVTAIKGFAETLLEGALEDPAASREFAGIILREAERLTGLVEDLLALSRIESGRIRMKREPVDLTVLAGMVVERFGSMAEKTGVSLVLSGEAGRVETLGDGRRLEQVLVNLVDNALKYTPAGGRVTVSTAGLGTESLVTVEDTGIGIPSEDLPRIFERFYRVDKARSRQLGGTGLGLSIVKHIVEAHGGSVRVESRPGIGSRFEVRLPLNKN